MTIKTSIVYACIAISFAMSLILAADDALAKAPPCSRSEIAIKDDRPGKNKICLKKREIAKAVKACGKAKWMQCICQDGASVGACGI